jgi:hypothetical protein
MLPRRLSILGCGVAFTCHQERRTRFSPYAANRNNGTTVIGDDEHAYNMGKKALPGTQRRDRYDHSSPVRNKDAGEPSRANSSGWRK